MLGSAHASALQPNPQSVRKKREGAGGRSGTGRRKSLDRGRGGLGENGAKRLANTRLGSFKACLTSCARDAVTLAAVDSALWCGVSVLRCVLMPMWAVSTTLVTCHVVNVWALASSLVCSALVLRMCNWLNVFRITARPAITQMIGLKPFIHRPVKMLPDEPIRRYSHPLAVSPTV